MRFFYHRIGNSRAQTASGCPQALRCVRSPSLLSACKKMAFFAMGRFFSLALMDEDDEGPHGAVTSWIERSDSVSSVIHNRPFL